VSKFRGPDGRISTAIPKVLRDTSRTKISVLAHYIPRTVGVQTKLKLVREDKRAEGAAPAEITLNPDEVESLHEFMHHFLGIASEADAQYVVIPLSGADVVDPADAARKLTDVLRQPGVADGLAKIGISVDVAGALQGAVRLAALQGAVSELRGRLHEGHVLERVFQDWCERHSWAFGNAYVARDDVRGVSAGDNLDLLMKRAASGLRDVMELKRSDMRVLIWDESHKCWHWSAETSAAIGQCHRYLDVLQEDAGKGLRDHPEVVAYHPRATIIIGRSHDWSDAQQRALHGLNARLHSITVMTYDHLLAQAEAMLASSASSTELQEHQQEA